MKGGREVVSTRGSPEALRQIVPPRQSLALRDDARRASEGSVPPIDQSFHGAKSWALPTKRTLGQDRLFSVSDAVTPAQPCTLSVYAKRPEDTA